MSPRIVQSRRQEGTAQRTTAEPNEHDRDRQLEHRVNARRQLGAEEHQKPADDEEHRRVPDPPCRGISDARPGRALLTDHGRDGDDVIGLEGVPEPLEEPEEEAKKCAHGASSMATPGHPRQVA
jgi:hypothetical protein